MRLQCELFVVLNWPTWNEHFHFYFKVTVQRKPENVRADAGEETKEGRERQTLYFGVMRCFGCKFGTRSVWRWRPEWWDRNVNSKILILTNFDIKSCARLKIRKHEVEVKSAHTVYNVCSHMSLILLTLVQNCAYNLTSTLQRSNTVFAEVTVHLGDEMFLSAQYW